MNRSLLGLDKQQRLVRGKLCLITLASATQRGELLRPLLPQQVRLSGIMAQQLSSGGDLEALGSRPGGLGLPARSLGLLVDAGHDRGGGRERQRHLRDSGGRRPGRRQHEGLARGQQRQEEQGKG